MKSLFAKIFNFIRNAKTNFDKWLEETDENDYPDDSFDVDLKCHICSVSGKIEFIPWDYYNNVPYKYSYFEPFYLFTYIRVISNLTRCKSCHQWTCNKHLNKDGVCLDCLKKQNETR